MGEVERNLKYWSVWVHDFGVALHEIDSANGEASCPVCCTGQIFEV